MHFLYSLFEANVSAICYSLADHYGLEGSATSSHKKNLVTQFVLLQHRQMTDYLRFPILVLTLLVSYGPVLIGRKCFTRQSSSERLQTLSKLKKSNFGPTKDLLRFYESLAVLPLYDQAAERALHAYHS